MAKWTFDPSQYQEKDFQIIPIGDHRVRIADVVERTYSSGNEGYEITLSVSGYNSKIWFNLVLDKNNVQQTNQRIGDFFNSFGITNPAMGTGKQWVGAVGAVRVKHREFNGNTRAEVAYCIARAKQDKLPPWKETSTAATAQAPSVAETFELPFDL